MPTRLYSSISQETTLAAALNNSATTMSVVNASGLLATITPAAGETFVVVIDPDTALEEIVEVISPSAPGNNTLTIQRNVDSSTAQAHSAGALVRHMAIGRDFREANIHIENTTTAHGITLANLVKTTDTGTVTGTMIANGTIVTADMADSAITTAKIADGAITSSKIADLGIATGDIADSAITGAKIATGAVGTTKIDDLSITEGKIAPTAVTTGKIADSAITSAKIADGTIVAGDIADGAITSAKILDGTITTGDIADSAITSAKIADGTIVAGDIADGAITSAKILDGTIVNADINASAAIAKTKLDLAGTITSSDIANDTIMNVDINTAAGISLSKLATDPLARANHTGTQVASTISDFDTQVRTSKLNQMAAPAADVSLATYKITNLGTPTVSTDASTKAYVDAQITALVGGAPGTLDTLSEIASAINNSGSFATSVVLRDGTQAMTGALAMGTNKITGLGTPTASTDAVTKAYADSILVGAPGNLTGPITSVGAATSIAAQTGTGTTFVVQTSPTLITPVLGVATATSINGTSIPSTKTLIVTTDKLSTLAATTSAELAGVISDETGTGSLVFGTGPTISNLTLSGTLTAGASSGTNGQVLQSTGSGVGWTTVSSYSAPTLGTTVVTSGTTITTISGLTDVVLNGPGSITDELTLILMGAL